MSWWSNGTWVAAEVCASQPPGSQSAHTFDNGLCCPQELSTLRSAPPKNLSELVVMLAIFELTIFLAFSSILGNGLGTKPYNFNCPGDVVYSLTGDVEPGLLPLTEWL